jgi:hypothetical protein
MKNKKSRSIIPNKMLSGIFSVTMNFFLRAFKRIKVFIVGLGDRGVLAGWIAGLLVLTIVPWALTENYRNQVLEKEINAVLSKNEKTLHLDRKITPWKMPGSAMQAGTWWTMHGSENFAVMFPVMEDGVFSPFIAIINEQNTVEMFLPMTLQGKSVLKKLKVNVKNIYTRRLETSAAILRQAVLPKEEVYF